VDVADTLHPGLRRVYESIRRLMAAATRNEARSRYQIGELVAEVKRAQSKYGAHAVEQLAGALRTNVHTLYRSASVAECWAQPELEAVLRRTTPRGQPLTWSHLVLLSGVPSSRRRGELLDQVLREALSVRELAALVHARRDPCRSSAGALVLLHRLERSTERWSEAAGRLSDEILTRLDGARSGDDDPVGLIERAIALHERLQGVVERRLAKLVAEQGRLRPRSSASDAVAGARLLAGMSR
jgi:hypothetical protein